MSTPLQALSLWRFALTSSVRSDAPDLSARQMAMLLCVYLGSGPHTVRGLAKDLKISKPAVSRALDRLGELGYIRRERDDLDRRNVLVGRTGAGERFLASFAQMIVAAQRQSAAVPDDQALTFAFESLSATAKALNEEERDTAAAWPGVAA